MKQLFFIGLFGLLLTGCYFGDNPSREKKLTKDFWLAWWDNKVNQEITLSNKDAFNGTGVIDKTVYAVGYDDNFIIAKQHPDKQDEIKKSLFGKRNYKEHFEISNLADTIYLNKGDTIYHENNKWYHTNNDWTVPDSLKPYKRITYFHIIDIRNYVKDKWDSYQIYSFDNEKEFISKRLELGVSKNLTFTIIDTTLK